MLRIRKAIEPDNEGLIALTRLTPMKGLISLRIDRKPDFFRLLRQRGDNNIVFIAEDEAAAIVGSFSATRQLFDTGGHTVPVYYLCDLKIHPQYQSSTLAFRLVQCMYKWLQQNNADLLFCTAASGNTPVTSFFNGRAGIPTFSNCGQFNIYQLLPKPFNDASQCKPRLATAELSGFYKSFYSRYFFHPLVNQVELCSNFTEEHNGITAAVSLYDPGLLKQNVVINYPFSTAMLLQALKAAKHLFDLPAIPQKGEALRILYVRYLAFANGFQHQVIPLLRKARQFAFQNNYHFLSVAAHERDIVLQKLIAPYKQFTFRSNAFVCSLKNNKELVSRISTQSIFEDYALV